MTALRLTCDNNNGGVTNVNKKGGKKRARTFFVGPLNLVVVAMTACFFVTLLGCVVFYVDADRKLRFHGNAGRNILKAVGVGVGTTLFTFGVTYMDSQRPGVSPPSPFSPRKIRQISGHTFHLNYTMAFVNGLVFFGITIWKDRENLLLA